VWWTLFGQTVSWGLVNVYDTLRGVPFLATVGAYGLSIMIVTLGIRLILSPLYQLQLRLSRRTMQEQRKVAPQIAELRKKHKGDSQKTQQAIMSLYKEHGINPLGGLMGCLPALVQFPVLSALYWVFLGNAHAGRFVDHFLFVPHLNDMPSHHPMLHGLPIPELAYLVIPLLAAGTTFVQSRMMQQPVNPMASDTENQTQQMTKQMQVLMPLVIGYFATVTPAGLGLYWFVSNCFAIIQQYLVNGWGGLMPSGAAVLTEPPPPPPGSIPAKKPRKPTR